MKSHWCAGQHTLNGKKHKTLGCGCCTVSDLREKHAKQYEHKDMQERLVDNYSYEEFMGDICMTDGEPCDLCKAAAERALRSNVISPTKRRVNGICDSRIIWTLRTSY